MATSALTNEKDNRVFLVIEYASKGNLFNYLKNLDKSLITEEFVYDIFHKICSAIEFMHSQHFVHRDIKPENILMDDQLNPKLCDFGWTIELHDKETRQTFCGTYEYMAPEIFETENYNSAVDIWSLGIFLYELIYGKSPFAGPSIFHIYKNIIKEKIEFNPPVNPLAISLIQMILQVNPAERPTIKEIMNHPYFQERGKTPKVEIKKVDANNEENQLEEKINSARAKIESLVHSSTQGQSKKVNSLFDLSLSKIDLVKKEHLHSKRPKRTLGRSFNESHMSNNNFSKIVSKIKKDNDLFPRNDSEVINGSLNNSSPGTFTPRYNTNKRKKKFFKNHVSNQNTIQEEISQLTEENKSVDSYIKSRSRSHNASKEITSKIAKDRSILRAKLVKPSLQKFHSNEMAEKSTAKPELEYGSNEQPVNEKFSHEKLRNNETENSVTKKHDNPSKVQSGYILAYRTMHDNKVSKNSNSDQFLQEKRLKKNQLNPKQKPEFLEIKPLLIPYEKSKELRSVSKLQTKGKFDGSTGSLSLKKQFRKEISDKDCLYSPTLNLDSSKLNKKELEDFVCSQDKSSVVNSKPQSLNTLSKNNSGFQQSHCSQTTPNQTFQQNFREGAKQNSSGYTLKLSNSLFKDIKGPNIKMPMSSSNLSEPKNIVVPPLKSNRNPPLKTKHNSKNSLIQNNTDALYMGSNLYGALTSKQKLSDDALPYDLILLDDSPQKKQIKKTKAVARFETASFTNPPMPTLSNGQQTKKGNISTGAIAMFPRSNIQSNSNSFLNNSILNNQGFSRKLSSQITEMMHKSSNSSFNLYPNK